ncbi:MAG: VOC family protein [Planctomycetota bacterium]|jgi:lactoylglutathione lyase|nr:VOC family protein [Planctomycetota bacterium]
MNLGAFSVSLAVKDLQKSIAFYQHLGFEQAGGDCGQGWTILKNGDHIIGLFQGMFDKNMLTFNPGWDQNAAELESFEDVRAIQTKLKAAGLSLVQEVDESGSGAGSLVVEDPDGNPILIDQHR